MHIYALYALIGKDYNYALQRAKNPHGEFMDNSAEFIEQ